LAEVTTTAAVDGNPADAAAATAGQSMHQIASTRVLNAVPWSGSTPAPH
jgi:hypothetical protein